MALSRPHHPTGHHHHHHHRSKPRRTAQQQGGSGAAGQPLAGPLRQLHDEYEEAMALGGGSSRDASEEDNDAFSEQSDSASSLRQHSQQQRYQQPSAPHSGRTMSSVAPPVSSSSSLYTVLSASPSSASSNSTSAVLNHLPVTARDRVLMDSRQHQQPPQASHQHVVPQARKASSGAAPAPSIGAIASTSSSSSAPQPPPPSSYTSATTTSRRNNPPSAPIGVAATLAKASAALSSSSSTDLSTYGGDDEATVDDDEADDGRSTSHEASSSVAAVNTSQPSTSGINRGVSGLRLGSLPPPPARPGTSSASTTPIAIPVPGARGAIGPTWMSRQDSDYLGDADDDDEDGGGVAGVGGFGSEADDEAVKAPRAVQPAATGSSVAPSGAAAGGGRVKGTGKDDATDEDDVSDGGTASPYDGDVEFAARTPVSQQIASSHGGASGSGAHAVAAAAPVAPASQQQQPTATRREVCDAPMRSYQRTPASNTTATVEGSATPRTGDAAGLGLSPTLVSTGGTSSSAQSGGEPSGSTLRASILALNEQSGALARSRRQATSAGPGHVIRIYVGAPDDDLFARVDGLAQCTAMLRVAKVGVAAAAAAADEASIDVHVIASIAVDDEAGGDGGSLRLPAAQRAALARGCRWVDEVIEGVPRAAAGQDDVGMKRALLEQTAAAQAGQGAATTALMARFVDADADGAKLSSTTTSGREEWEIRLPMPRSA